MNSSLSRTTISGGSYGSAGLAALDRSSVLLFTSVDFVGVSLFGVGFMTVSFFE